MIRSLKPSRRVWPLAHDLRLERPAAPPDPPPDIGQHGLGPVVLLRLFPEPDADRDVLMPVKCGWVVSESRL